MPKTALVLSGGGAKGAFQAAAEKYARKEAGYRWDVISGVSVGALNGAVLAMGNYEQLEAMWKNITDDQVYTGKKNWWALVRMLFGDKAVHGHEPLKQLIESKFDPYRLTTRLIIGAVDLITGEYEVFDSDEERIRFRDALLASTAIPVLFPPVKISDSLTCTVDGAIRNLSPVGEVLRADPDQIVIINCNPRRPGRLDGPPKNALEIGERSLDIMMNEIFIGDIESVLRINRLVEQASKFGVVLRNRQGRAYKHYKCVIIEPDEPLGYTLDFSRDVLDKAWEDGWNKAKEVLG